jgi:NAD(P)-dependent dehydrogenase (short-subunit alcohol dehydrogenase family)
MAPVLGAASMEPLTKALAVDLAPIRTNVIVLGPFRTPLLEQFLHNNEEAENAMKDQTLLKDIGGAEEAAEAYLYCMRCAFVTGSRIDCEGGALLR